MSITPDILKIYILQNLILVNIYRKIPGGDIYKAGKSSKMHSFVLKNSAIIVTIILFVHKITQYEFINSAANSLVFTYFHSLKI